MSLAVKLAGKLAVKLLRKTLSPDDLGRTAGPVPYPANAGYMKAPPDVVKWAKSAEGVDVSHVDWNRDDKEDVWQAFVDHIADGDRQAAAAARDRARAQILDLAKGSFWEQVAWPGHAEAHSSRQVLQTAAGQLPAGQPRALEWTNSIERVRGTIEAARELLRKAELPGDVARADRILDDIGTAYARARHAIEAPEIIEGKIPPAPTPPPDKGSGWLWWLAGGLLVASLLSDKQREEKRRARDDDDEDE